jgi:hypothetical protein
MAPVFRRRRFRLFLAPEKKKPGVGALPLGPAKKVSFLVTSPTTSGVRGLQYFYAIILMLLLYRRNLPLVGCYQV